MSPDLQRLRDEGYDLSLVGGMLVVRGVPFVDRSGTVRQGFIAVALELAGNRTVPPRCHAVLWGGRTPCDRLGSPLTNVVSGPYRRTLGSDLTVTHQLCNQPHGREFEDYHELVTTYVALLSVHARWHDPASKARASKCARPVEDADTPFRYMDTATARAGVGGLAARYPTSVGIVGLGGTGGYVLDLVAKTPVRRIHLFDADVFLQHNAFRAPGAASLADLKAQRAKVDHFAAVYSAMHTGIVPHRTMLGTDDLEPLSAAEFVFLCMDDGATKEAIIDRLERDGKSFIDVGIGVELGERGLFGSVRVTTSTPRQRHHVRDRQRISFLSGHAPDPYASNIQIAELNALNAALAVLRWKRLMGFYVDGGHEHHSTYDIDGNHMNNADRQVA